MLLGRLVVHVQQSVKSVRRGAERTYVLHWKSSRMWARFQTTPNVRIWSFLKTTMHFNCFARPCCSLSYSSFSTRTLRHCGCIYAFCILFHFRTRLLASSLLPSQFWCHNNETASAATALRIVSLHNFCKQDILIAFLSGTDVCAQATPLSVTSCIPETGRKSKLHPANREHTLPTVNTHSKIVTSH